MLDWPGCAGQAIEYAVDKAVSLLGTETVGEFNGFVEYDAVGNVRMIEQFSRADSQNHALHRVEAGIQPIDMRLELFVEMLTLINHLAHKFFEVLGIDLIKILLFKKLVDDMAG